MTAFAYFLIGGNGEETMPRIEVADESADAVGWFADVASSESIRALDRPGFVKLHKSARRGDVLIVSALNRLGNSREELLEVFQALKAIGVALFSVREDLYLFGSEGAATRAMFGSA